MYVTYLHRNGCAVRVFVIIFVSRHAMSIVHSSLLFHSCRCCSTIECYGSVTRAVATRLCSSGVSETDNNNIINNSNTNNSNNNYSNWLLFHFLCTVTRTHTHTPTSNKRLAERKSFVDTCRGCCSTTKASRSANRHNLPMPCPILIATFPLPMHMQFYALPCDNMGHPHRSYPPSPSHR